VKIREMRVIVQLITDEGITGLGETYGGAIPLRDLEAARERVIGQDPWYLTRIEAAVAGDPTMAPNKDRPWEGTLSSPVQTFSPIEVACYDIIGKATGRPVADLLGGRYREAVPFSAYLFYKHAGLGGADGLAEASKAARERDDYLAREALSVDGIVRQAREFVDRFGFQSIKLKAGVLPPDVEADSILAMREALGPDTPLRIDPNCIWSVETSVRIAKRLAGVLYHLLVRHPGDGRARLDQYPALRPPPLGRAGRDGETGATLPGLRLGCLDALQFAPGHQPHGDGARRGGDSESHLRLRHALSLAG
jgi:glucarate dehydratase